MRNSLLPRLLIGLALMLCAALPFLAAGCGEEEIVENDLGIDMAADLTPPPDLLKNLDLGDTD
jgi:hypothetical protein